jgi:tetratricopeptide (TPR) repeat protein
MPVMTMSGEATLAAAEGLAALGVGDTALARQKYAEAGAILEREMHAHGGSEKQLLRFLAATQYYKGGDYQKAQELANKIDARALPKNVRGLLPQFLKDVKQRVARGYARNAREVVRRLWLEGKPREAIQLLQDHPYIFDAAGLAFMRAVLCERLGDYRAAAIFFSSVLRFAPTVSDTHFLTAAYPLALVMQNRVSEAWDYTQHQLELLPHAVTYITAAVISYHRFRRAGSEDREHRLNELLAFVEKARNASLALPEEQQNHPDMRAYLALGFELAAGGWLLQGNKERSKEAWEDAIKLGGSVPTPEARNVFAASADGQAETAPEAQYLAEREAHFSTRFAPEPAIRQQLELIEA